MAGSYSKSTFNIFKKLPNCFPKWLHHLTFPPAMYEGSNFSLSLLTLVIVRFLFVFLKYIYLFIFGCVGSSLLCAGFLWLRRAGATLCCGVQASLVAEHGLQAHGLQQLWLAGSRVQAQQLCARAQLLHGMWDLPEPGIEPMSPALAGGFLTTVPPGKSPGFFVIPILVLMQWYLMVIF